jgi:hypothetical protein
MENIIYEAGYLITYALSELDIQKEINPIYFHIDLEYKRKTKEIKGIDLSESIPKAIKKLEKNLKKTLSNLVIFPAEVESELGVKEPAVVAIIYDNSNNKKVTISIPYNLGKDKISIKEYEIIDVENIKDEELMHLETIFNKGLLAFEQGSYIWQECFEGKSKKTT